MYPIKVARRDKDTGKIHHETDGQPDKIYRDIRAGFSWPYKSAPPYYCMFGQPDRQNEFKRYPLVILSEGQSSDLHALLDKLTDDAKRLLCEGICVDLTGERECYKDIFSDYCEETNTQGLYLIQAPWPENFSYGLGLIRDWLKKRALEIERGTILAEQLGKIHENLSAHATEPEVDFFAVNALRYVLGTFQKHPWQSPNLPPIETLFKGQDREQYHRWAWGIR
jgi:hypothetical protein